MTAPWILGVDPGCPGALALLDPAGVVRRLQHGPTREQAATGAGKKREEIDGPALHRLARDLLALVGNAPRVAAIEAVSSRPTDSVVSAFKFGDSVRAWVQALEVEGWPILRPHPRVWQARVPGIAGQGDARRASYHAAALARWPDQRGVLVGPRGGARLDPAAALWIAEFARTTA